MLTNTTDECVQVVEEMIKDYNTEHLMIDRGSEMRNLIELYNKFCIKITKCDAGCPQQKGQIEGMNNTLRGMGVRDGCGLKNFIVHVMKWLQWGKNERKLRVLNKTCPNVHVHKILKVPTSITKHLLAVSAEALVRTCGRATH